jgi:hypothetical protein
LETETRRGSKIGICAIESDGKSAEKKMNPLRMEAIGGVPMVTVVIDTDGTTSSPFITIVAAPLVATFTPPMKDNGILYALASLPVRLRRGRDS